MALHLDNRPAEAIAPLREAADKEPSRGGKSLACFYLAEAAHAVGKKEEAKARWKQALDVGGLDAARRARAEEGLRGP
jgi:cytochrome c-type biogenesis protein CcmH/NrfG